MRKSTGLCIAALAFVACGGAPPAPEPWEACTPPYPASRHLRLAVLGEGTRYEALDGDNWPTTWAADDAVYTSYGDGWGARPDTAPKLNVGVLRLSGHPPAVSGVELPLPYLGRGASDPNLKSSGLLAVDSTLYLFLRYQVDTEGPFRRQVASTVLWSHDFGTTWDGTPYGERASALEFLFPPTDSAFHSVFVLQAGRDHAIAPDSFVYLYSPNEQSRQLNDALVLARVSRRAIRDRDAYRFFSGLGEDGAPIWTDRLAERQPAFRFPDHVAIGSAAYLPVHDRFVLVMARSDFEGPSTLGLYDAPAPWGPWTTVGCVARWGTGREGDTRYEPRLVAKWISADGLSLELVYSDKVPSDKLNVQAIRLEAFSDAASTFTWPAAEPDAGGHALDSLWNALSDSGTAALLVIQRDRIVYERYADARGVHGLRGTASLAKALVASLALGILADDGRLALDARVSDYVPEWRADPRRRLVTPEQLARHSSGLDHAGEGMPGGSGEREEWQRRFWNGRELLSPTSWFRPADPFVIARDEVPMVGEPGTGYRYSAPGYAMLGYVMGIALAGTPYRDVPDLLDRRVMRPLGIDSSEWRMGYGRVYETDGMRLHANWGGAAFTTRATARLGRLLLAGGQWQGRRILSAATVASLTHGAPGGPSAGAGAPRPALGWWSNADGGLRSLPTDAFLGAGSGGPLLLVVPSLELIVVRYGNDPGLRFGPRYWSRLEAELIGPLMRALTSAPRSRASS